MKILLRYLIFVGIPYAIARSIEKYFWKHASPELKKELKKNLKNLPELDTVSEVTKDSLDTRGGANPLILWFVKVVVTNSAIKAAIAGAVGASIWSETADNAAAQLAKYGSALLATPGKKFLRLYNRIKGIDPQHSLDIKEILLDKELTNQDKLDLLKIKIERVLKNLKGSKRKQFILLVISAILFSVGGNFALFAWFMERLRALLGTNDDVETLREYIIESYREYNAPLPQELAEELSAVIVESIPSVKSITRIE
uniref:Uncharacterized protein n=1 Tax=Toxarium undulatum TaxID=210620 RepID=A0A1D8D9P6_9STRA|nr:hypothetical protein [Toxarium undulatum]AOS86678.1 hypothetical protein [Toxarium undulatum]